MTPLPEDRLRAFLHRETASLPEQPGTPYERLGAKLRHRRRRRTATITVCAAAIAITAIASAAAVGFGHAKPGPGPGIQAAAALPATLAPPKAPPSITAAPLPRAAALIETGVTNGSATLNDPILVSATGQYRTVPLTQITPDTVASYALSPDGSRLAIGIDTKPAGTVAVLTLRTGDVARFPLRGTGALGEVVQDLVWSPDGSRLAYSATITTQLSAHGGVGEGAGPDLGILDLATRAITELPAMPIGWSADSQHVLLSQNDAVSIADQAGHTIQRIDLGSMVGLDIGKNSWSPDGQRLAVISREGNLDDAQTNPHQYTLRLPTVRGSGATAATATFTLGTLTEPPTVIGWSGDHHVIIGEPSAAGAMDIRAIDVHDGHIEPVSRVTDARATAVELPASTLSQLAPSLSSNDAS